MTDEPKTFTWQTNWELKSLTYAQLFEIIETIITRRVVDEIQGDKPDVQIDKNFYEDYNTDSVDIIAMLLNLDVLFKNASPTESTVFPTNKVKDIEYVGDLFDLIYETLLGVESKMDPFVAIKPDFDALEKQKKIGSNDYSTIQK